MKKRNHLIVGFGFIGTCVLIGVVLFVVSAVTPNAAEPKAAAMTANSVAVIPAAATTETAPTSGDSSSEQWTAYNFDDANSALNDIYGSLMKDLPAADRITLGNSQRQWLAERNRQCGLEAQNDCAKRMTEAKALELDRQWTARFMPHTGDCFSTAVKEVGTRLEDDPDQTSGASISYEDGHYQVDYDSSPKTLGFNNGDPVQLCVVSLPTNCPPGDHRGIEYKAVDLATQRSWAAADSEHGCGGA